VARVPADLADAGAIAVRIALVCPYDLARPGGVQGQTAGIAAALAARGHVVAVAAPYSGAPLVDIGESTTLFGLGGATSVAANGSTAPVALSPATFSRTRSALRSFGPDVVHLHEPLAPLVGFATLLGAPAPIVATVHRSGISDSYRMIGRLAHRLVRRIAVGIAVSDEARATAEAALGSGVIQAVIPNGVALETWQDDGDSVREPIVCFSRHEPRKGIDVLLEAYTALAPSRPLHLASSGPDTDRLRARYGSSPGVSFLGRLSQADLAAELQHAALVVVPGLSGESFGVVLLEAMAAGAPIIASDLPGFREAGGDAVQYVPPGDTTALKTALGRLLDDEPARRELAALGSARAARFSFASIAEAYEAQYSAALSRQA
jgi:phosphatidyl-myo-inositol alpha-mannosyltransferase